MFTEEDKQIIREIALSVRNEGQQEVEQKFERSIAQLNSAAKELSDEIARLRALRLGERVAQMDTMLRGLGAFARWHSKGFWFRLKSAFVA